jgi:hypothetical protein
VRCKCGSLYQVFTAKWKRALKRGRRGGGCDVSKAVKAGGGVSEHFTDPDATNYGEEEEEEEEEEDRVRCLLPRV